MSQRTAAAAGPLNVVQRVMCYWSALHPYNANHTYKLAGPVRRERLQDAIRETYARHGLGFVNLDLARGVYWHEPDMAPEVQVLPGGATPEQRLSEHLTTELNRPYERPRCRPFRFTVIDAGPDAHHLSVVYDHWVADSIAVRLLLQRVLGRYCGFSSAGDERPLTLYPRTYRHVFPRRLGPLHAVRVMGRTLVQWWQHRHVAQVPYAYSTEMRVQYECYPTAAGTVAQLTEFARSLGATVHDVILAALGRALDGVLPRRRARADRELALGTIVDTRADAGEDLRDALGVFLSYYSVHCRPGTCASLAELTRRIAADTKSIKAARGYLDSLVHWKLEEKVWPWLSPGVRRHFTRRALPLTGGVSNVRIRDCWIDREGAGRILDLARAAPTGPMLPLALTPTTLHDRMNIGVTYRVTGFPRSRIDGIMQAFLEQIQNPFAA